jgi:hypothetical protein
MERRKAMRFRTHIASHAMPEARQDICASRRSMPLVYGARTRQASRALAGRNKSWPNASFLTRRIGLHSTIGPILKPQKDHFENA